MVAAGDRDPMTTILFCLLAVAALATALVVVGHRNPAVSVFFLIVHLCLLAGIFLLLDNPFVATIQVILYAGAIMVLFLFVVMLLNPAAEGLRENSGMRRWFTIGLLAVFLTLTLVAVRSFGGWDDAGALAEAAGDPVAIARSLFTDYLIPFEAASMMLLAALIGVVTLSHRGDRGEES